MRSCRPFAAAMVLAFAAAVSAAPWVLLDGFNEGGVWGPASWGAAGTSAGLSTNRVSEGCCSLEFFFPSSGENDKAWVMAEQPYDLSHVEDLSLDIFNAGPAANYAELAVSSGEGWEWQELVPQKLMPGWNRDVVFRISGNWWKSESSQWVNMARLSSAADVRRLLFGFFGSGGPVYLDNLRIRGSGLKGPQDETPGTLSLWEGFENGAAGWDKVSGEPLAVSAEPTPEQSSEGKNGLKLVFKSVTSSQKASFALERPMDWVRTRKVLLDIYNPGPSPLQVSLALATGPNWTWYESAMRFLASGWNRNVSFPLNEPVFKTEASKWKNTAFLAGKKEIHRVILNVFGAGTQAVDSSVVLDNIRLEEAEAFEAARQAKPAAWNIVIDPLKYRQPAIRSVASLKKEVAFRSKYELAAEIDSFFDNPFDPDEIKVDAEISTPSGAVLNCPMFFYRDFDDSGNPGKPVPKGTDRWLLRFAPDQPGEWSVVVTAKNPAGTVRSGRVGFSCTGKAGKAAGGFVKPDGRFFRLENGDAFVAVGMNVGWILPNDPGDYSSYFSKMAAEGCNWSRVWNTTWGGDALESGYARLDLASLWKFDRIFEAAESSGIAFQFVFDHHNVLSDRGSWDSNPYNYNEGGPCSAPREFFTNAAARKTYRNKIRYLVSRFGYSRGLFAWEFWNEVDLTSGFDETAVASWHQEMARYLRSIDVHHRPLTTSLSRPTGGGMIWQLPEIDIVQTHLYTDDLWAGAEAVCGLKRQYDKPHIIAEAGAATQTCDDESSDKTGRRLIDAVWSAGLSEKGCGATAMYWWWDCYVGKYGLYPVFGAYAKASAGIDRTKASASLWPVSLEGVPLSDLFFTPPLGWEKSLTDSVEVTAAGEVTGGNQMSSFFQGQYHRDLSGDKTFAFNAPKDGSFSLQVLKSASSGAKIVILLDAVPVLTKEFPAATSDVTVNQTLSVPFTKGKHTVTVRNEGLDWITVGVIRITGVSSRLSVKGLTDGRKGVYFIRDSASGSGEETASLKTRAVLAGLPARTFRIAFIDPFNGRVLESRDENPRNGVLSLATPEFRTGVVLTVEQK